MAMYITIRLRSDAKGESQEAEISSVKTGFKPLQVAVIKSDGHKH